MRYPQVLVYEGDGSIARLLREPSQMHRWSLREPRQPESCLRLLRRGGPSVLVLKVGRDLVRELGLLERVSQFFPDTATVVVGDAEDATLAGLAWDLGAGYVLFPPQSRDLLPGIVAGLVQSGIRKQQSALGREPSTEIPSGPLPNTDAQSSITE